MPQLAEVEEAIDGAQQMSARHVLLEVEGIEKLVLPAALLTHHGRAPVVEDGLSSSENDASFSTKSSGC